MTRRSKLKALFYANVGIVVLLLVYKLYLNLFLPDFQAEHSKQLQRIQQRLEGSNTLRFAVLGNINNSVGIFERRIVPELNRAGFDFVVSAGNAVSGGGEDKYRALQGSLSHLDMPYLLTFGENEHDDFGSYRFYEHFGPHFFSFHLGQTHFVFLDSTGKTPWQWQLLWLDDLLEADQAQHRFLFLGHPLFQPKRPPLFDDEENYLQPKAFRDRLLQLIQQHNFDAVFSSNLPMLDRHRQGQTQFINTGGGGGLVLNTKDSFYHYLDVRVSGEGTTIKVRAMDIGQPPLVKQLEGIWFAVYSLFYVGFLNFLLIVSVLVIAAIKLHQLIFTDRDYYPNFDLDPSPWMDRPLHVAMFSNNYLPFIGGVPLSIQRLREGLQKWGDRVWLVVPSYRDQPEAETDVLRLPSLLSMGQRGEFRLANIFQLRSLRQLKMFGADIVHVHHPVWVGSLGVFLARRLRLPVIYTYHTRLEHYAHFVPLPGALFRNLISHALIKRFANKCDAVVVPTYSAEDYLRMIGVKVAIYVQPTGIDFDAFDRRDEAAVAALRQQLAIGDEPVLISVSRLSNEKNIDFMIEALAELKHHDARQFTLLIIGEGHQRQRLQQKIDQLDMSRTIRLIGAVAPEQMPLYYQLGEVFVFASKSETQGMVILEAMAAGLPVVAVRSSGIDDVIREGDTGFTTRETRRQWLDALIRLLDDPVLRRQMAGRARDFARDHSLDNVARRVKHIYARVLAQREYLAQQDRKPRR